jgi:hypothetical protein
LALSGQFGISREDFEVQLGSMSDWMAEPDNVKKANRIRASGFKQFIWNWLVREFGPPKGA